MKAILRKLLLLVNVYGAVQRVDPIVLTDQGLVRGQKATDGDYSKFLGIPYAKVDLDNPFGDAGPAPSFEEEILNAFEATIRCPQTPFSGYACAVTNSAQESVDCLQLNIFVPTWASVHDPIPVLVWIHGGVFTIGTGHEFGARHLTKHGIIVVTINYRLGAYGFMCLNNPTAPGNQGLKDQHAALKWVRDNIEAFGGDPNNVTIAGQGAGSASALLHLFSPTEKLFDKVIAQSGTPLSPVMFTNGDPDAAVKLANYLGHNAIDDQQALDFLAKTNHSLVTGATHALKIEFKPCKENPFTGVDIFVENEPFSLSNERKIRNTPILIGNTDLEYRGDIRLMHGDDFFDKDIFHSRLKHAFIVDKDDLFATAEIVRHFYIGDKVVSLDVNTEAECFRSDFVFNHPIQDTITRVVNENASPVYAYVFRYVGDSGFSGAAHSAELPYLFDLFGEFESMAHSSTDDDLLMVDRLTTLWANFIKYGNPTPETSELIPVRWTPVAVNLRPYLNIDKELRMETEERFLKERMAFWDLFYSIYRRYNIFA